MFQIEYFTKFLDEPTKSHAPFVPLPGVHDPCTRGCRVKHCQPCNEEAGCEVSNRLPPDSHMIRSEEVVD